MSNLRLRNYSDFTARCCGLIGIPYSGMTDEEKTFLQGYFDSGVRTMWDLTPWMDVCPYGEARFAGNQISYPNDLTKASYWQTGFVSVQANSISNPADGRVTASKIIESTSSSSDSHAVSQSTTFIPNTQYILSSYLRPNGRDWAFLAAGDGGPAFSAYFNINSGVVGTSANLSQQATIVQQNNGFWLCSIYFTSSVHPSNAAVVLGAASANGVNTFSGDPTKGMYSWGNLLLQTSFADPTSLTIPWRQTGEDEIDAVFQVWKDSPANAGNPRRQGYELNPNGIQLVGPIGYNLGVIYNSIPTYYTPTQLPVYLYYRKPCPNYTGPDYSSTATYAIDDQVLFEDSDGVLNFYKCIVATSAGQSPESTPASWQLLEIPEVFFNFAVYSAYADWLRMDGQTEKAASVDALAQRKMDDESDKQERQQGWVLPMNVYTHVTSQFRRS